MPLAFQLIKVRGWGCGGAEEEEEEDEVEEEACALVSLTKGPRFAAGDDEEEEDEEVVLTTGKWRFIVIRRVCVSCVCRMASKAGTPLPQKKPRAGSPAVVVLFPLLPKKPVLATTS